MYWIDVQLFVSHICFWGTCKGRLAEGRGRVMPQNFGLPVKCMDKGINV